MHVLDRRPLYIQAHDWLLALIEEEGLQPGDQLPSETRLAGQLGISRATLREALRLLEKDRRISRQQGVGTFVMPDRHLESGLERLESILSLAERQGMTAQVDALCSQSVEADEGVAERLSVPPGTLLVQICRAILVEGQPVAYMEDLVPQAWLALEDLDEAFSGSVLDFLRLRKRPDIHEALAEITAVPAGRALAKRLEVRPGTALLLLEETLFDALGTPIGFSRNYFVPNRFRFHVVRK
ncbi:MAG: GntR family transcriptional regulator [Anaerolineae bacterium]|nr:GntR family transcriptional regulator [Anaerolineae bacterium]